MNIWRVPDAWLEQAQDDATILAIRDMENAGNRHTRMICEVMRKIRLPWSMMCRADTVKEDTWREMKLAGCFGVKSGFESASDRITNQVVGII